MRCICCEKKINAYDPMCPDCKNIFTNIFKGLLHEELADDLLDIKETAERVDSLLGNVKELNNLPDDLEELECRVQKLEDRVRNIRATIDV